MAFLSILTIILGAFFIPANEAINNSFYAYYSYLWGSDHFSINPQGTEVQLNVDKYSGAGFRSKLEYGSGLFHIRMKIPQNKTGGIVTSFYLDYEFLGTNGTVQTNVYDNDTGHREQSFDLWFDSSKDFHTYEILWNPYQIVLTIDSIQVRVFKYNMAQGVAYPTKPMHIEASIWNADDWAGVVDWRHAPFIAHYSDFGFKACPAQGNNISGCASDHYYWSGPRYRQLNAAEKRQMNYYRRKYMSYDYCRKPSTRKKECSLNV
ncbi:hypothetical protein Pfo_025670 [Paulownia fortunei]|nr:hypothetical protein Pfo_025670 [Paulownia fortunei]